MDFGALSRNRPFEPGLAPVHPGSEILLAREPKLDRAELPIFIGGPQWNIPGVSRSLTDYVGIWNSIELNAAFYRNPTPEGARKWADQTPGDFAFFVKVNQQLSHEFSLWNDRAVMSARRTEFRDPWRGVHEKWAGSFLQLPPAFGFDRLEILKQWLAEWSGSPLFVEFRHESWFVDRQIRREAARVVATARMGLVCTDTPGRRDASHGTLTTPELFVRFLGQSEKSDPALLPIDRERLEIWFDRIAALHAQGLQKLVFFMHTPDLAWTPELTRIFAEGLRVRGFNPNVPERNSKGSASDQLPLL
jgi:uncharacterized protein YecE (DUF72 family)